MTEASVGDLRAGADRETRRLLGQTVPSDRPSLATGYADVLQGAYQVLAATPTRPSGLPGTNDRGDYLSVRAAQMISPVDRFKPLHVDPPPGTIGIGETWQQAAALLHRHAHPGLARDSQARGDAAAARVKVARTVAALAHVTSRELQGYIRQVQQAERPQQPTPPRQTPVTALRRSWIPMLQGRSTWPWTTSPATWTSSPVNTATAHQPGR